MARSLTGATPAASRKETGVVVKSYLILYNFLQVVGWSYIYFLLVSYYVSPPKETTLWEHVKLPVVIFQNAALLEIFHAAFGLVSSNVFITAAQVYSRVMVVCGVLLATPTAPLSVGLPLLLFAWSVTEIIRYSFYGLGLLGCVPYFLTWCRYTFFIALYPIGITGELLCIWAAYLYVSETDMWSAVLPNSLNFTFSYGIFLILNMVAYIPVFPKLYLHMFSQRKKIIGNSNKVTKKTK